MERHLKTIVPLVGFVVFGLANSVDAADRYVRAGATGAGNGSDWANAYTALPSSLVRGDTYFIADGVYPGYSFDDATAGGAEIAIRKATTADHGTSTGWSNTFGDGQAVFSAGLAFTTSDWEFDGVTGGGPGAWNVGFGFKIIEARDSVALVEIGRSSVANNISVRHVEFQGKGSVSTSGGGDSNDAVAAWNADNVTISYTWMHGIGRCPFFMSPNNFLAEYVYVESFYASSGVHAELASLWAIGQSVGNTTFRWNLFAHSAGTGGIMWDNSSNSNAHIYVYGNVIYRPAGEAWERQNGIFGGWTGNNGEQCRNFHLYNNTFINIDQSSLSTLMNVVSGNEAINNLWYNSESPQFSKFPTHDYNHFINAGGAHSEAHGTSSASGNPFADFVNLDFRLVAATATGNTLPAPFNKDMFGTVRGGDGVWDRGALEFASSQYTPPSGFHLEP